MPGHKISRKFIGEYEVGFKGLEQGRGMKGKLLLIDDEKAFLKFLRCVFERDGYRVEAASTARAGLELAQKKHFDVIVTDMMMPDMDGADLVARLRAAGNEAPVVAITGFSASDINLETARRHRIDYLVYKPFSAIEILSAVERAMQTAVAAPPSPSHGGEGGEYLPFRNGGLS